MTTKEPATGTFPEDGRSWRELAVARSLDSARTRAENRVQRFMDAALELVNAGAGKDFTVQEVVERSGQSLRSFYQYFDGKHELLLALFEESITSTVEYLGGRVAAEDGPLERLHTFVVEYYELCRPTPGGNSASNRAMPVMAEFAWQLLTEHPKEAARAFRPLVSMFRDLLDAAAAAGFVRPGLRSDRAASNRAAGVVIEAIMFNGFSVTIGGTSTRRAEGAAEELWEVLYNGIGVHAAS